jgi:archaeal chaperonin
MQIALVNSPLEIEKTEYDAKLNINSPEQMQRFLDEENKMLKSMVDKISSVGAIIQTSNFFSGVAGISEGPIC